MIMSVKDKIKQMGATGVIAAAMAELQKERVKDATGKLKCLIDNKQKARKVYRNACRAYDDFVEELGIDDDDFAGSEDD
jgi:intergrase/recombinase